MEAGFYMKRKIDKNIAKKIWRLLAPFHKDFYEIFGITVVFQVVRMGGPYIFGKILDILGSTKGYFTFDTAIFVVGGLVGIRLLSLLVDYISDLIQVRFLWKSEQYVSRQSYNKLLELSLDYHEKENTGNKINIVNKGRDKLVDLLATFGWNFQPVIIQLVVSAIAMVFVNWIFGIIFIFSLIPFAANTYFTYKSTSTLRSRRHDAYEFSSGEIGDTLANITVVKAYAQETRESKTFTTIWDNIKILNVKEFTRHFINGFLRSFGVEVFFAALLIIGIFEVQNGFISVGSLVFLIILTERAYSNIFQLGWLYERAADASEPVDRVINLLDKKSTVVSVPGAIKIGPIKGNLEFKEVTFGYGENPVLRDLSFQIPAGSFTALVGKSGSGKSTIAKLISRYYDPNVGQIIIDDKFDLKKIDLESFRKQVAVVFQDSPVPNRRIWEVISYSGGKSSFASVKDEVIEAAKLAHAHEFITEFKKGYQTIVGERGIKLSGGQRQRIAIARALFARPKILLMDEPTSHLDTLSEAKIQLALVDLSKEHKMTKIIIAHRLSTVQRADNILVMEKGKLVEEGTHQELLEKKGIYAQIVAQSELKS